MGSSIEPLSSATGSATPAHPAVKVGINWLVVEDPRDIELTVDVCMQPLLRLTRIAQAATHKRTLTGVGIVGFYYLPEKTKIKVNVTYGESRHEFDVQTGARDPSLPCATSFIDPKTIMTPSIMFGFASSFVGGRKGKKCGVMRRNFVSGCHATYARASLRCDGTTTPSMRGRGWKMSW
eukprot:GEMP01072393.1.p1 GENE.GEMP01072393.1~~GEMP01072393.1.p1  ORF type:complete len:179 (+),score=25.36 GEMP01072393.1:97-633(+)